MKINFLKIFFLLACFFLLPSFVSGEIIFDGSGKWETTFDCAQWEQPLSGPWTTLNCDGLERSNDTLIQGEPLKIALEANNPKGAGGCGASFAVADGDDIASGNFKAGFPALEKELWIRWYMFFPENFSWGPFEYQKYMFIRGLSLEEVILEPAFQNGSNLGAYRFVCQGSATATCASPIVPHYWSDVMGGSVGDGKWHSYEIHLKMDTNNSDGEGDLWIDGNNIFSVKNVNYSRGDETARLGWNRVNFISNQNWPNNGGVRRILWDDMKIHSSTPPNLDANGNPFIGVIVDEDVTSPSAPASLSVI
ncbi:MAG: hypothetical protein HGA36_02880 [Candidatus Moranbacteria bacterium]|nr:hypothetical protein [Candidatus Moranbacteria bacterium]